MTELAVPQTSQGWEYKFIPHLTDGVSTAVRPEDITDSQLVKANNVRFERNRILIDTGYRTFGQELRGDARATYQFYRKDGSSYLVCITDETFYVWSTSVEEWQYVNSGVSTDLSSEASSGDTELSVDSIDGFSDGDFVGILLSDGSQFRTAISGAPSGSTITLADAVPETIDSGSTLVQAVFLTGNDTIPVSSTVFSATDYFIFTNGVDTPKKFDGNTCEDLEGLPGSSFTARIVLVYKDHLVFMHTTESGNTFPQRVRRSTTADPEDWTTLPAGHTDVFNAEDSINAAGLLGPYVIIYKERSIVRMEYLGAEDALFGFQTMIQEEGVKSSGSVVNLDDEHIFLGRSNIYRYRGDYSVTPIGDPIYYSFFSTQAEINPSLAALIQSVYIAEINEFWFFYPKTPDETARNVLKTPSAKPAFSTRTFTDPITGHGFYVLQITRTWASLEGDWSDQTWEWSSRINLASSPTMLLCAGNQVMEYNYAETRDNNVSIPYEVETKDFYLPNVYARFDKISFSARGEEINLYYSTDEGNSWSLLKTVSPGNEFRRVRVYRQFVSTSVRFRFTGEGGSFGLEWLAFEYTIESEH